MQALRRSKGACFLACIPRPPACQCIVKQHIVRRCLKPAGRYSGRTWDTWPSRSGKGRTAVHTACRAARVGADGAAAGPRKTVEGASEDIRVIWSRLVKVGCWSSLPLICSERVADVKYLQIAGSLV